MEKLKQQGVDIRTGTRVEQIIIEKGKTQEGYRQWKFIPARAVISNAGITNTVDNLIGRQNFSDSFSKAFHGCPSQQFELPGVFWHTEREEIHLILVTCSSPLRKRSSK